jgi:hypothetical protein
LPSDIKPTTSTATDESFAASAFPILMDDRAMLESCLNYPTVDEDNPFTLDFEAIAKMQNYNNDLLKSLASDKTKVGHFQMNDKVNLIYYIPNMKQPFKICIPDALVDTIICFYHLALNHVG